MEAEEEGGGEENFSISSPGEGGKKHLNGEAYNILNNFTLPL